MTNRTPTSPLAQRIKLFAIAFALAGILVLALVLASPGLSGARPGGIPGANGNGPHNLVSMDHQYKACILHKAGPHGKFVQLFVPRNSAHFTRHTGDRQCD